MTLTYYLENRLIQAVIAPKLLGAIVVKATLLGSITASIAAEIPEPRDVCNVLKDAYKLHGKVVALKGNLIVGPETTAIYGQRCKQVAIDGAKCGAAVTLSFPNPRQPLSVELQTLIDSKSVESLWDHFNASDKLGIRGCEAVVVGVLTSRDEKLFYTDKNGKRKRIGFGHLNAFPAELLVVNVRRFGEIRKIEVK